MELSKNKPLLTIGLMSGTSADGIDSAALITDGQGVVDPIGFHYAPYAPTLQSRIIAAFGQITPTDTTLARDITLAHVDAVHALCAKIGKPVTDFDLIGFHGQTVYHNPAQKITVQLGDGGLLAKTCGVSVVGQFRLNDVAAGGQGAPLIPIYHHALSIQLNLPLPVLFLNIGGVANVTYIPTQNPDDMVAFDCGPGNALIDDFMRVRTGKSYDANGATAATGTADTAWISNALKTPFFVQPVPKSLDRNAFHGLKLLETIPIADGAATLTQFTAQAVAECLDHLPQKPHRIIVCGGGRHNQTLLNMLGTATQCTIQKIDAFGFDGDAIEAQGFGYLAVRSTLGLPLSFPKTTGVPNASCGGHVHYAA